MPHVMRLATAGWKDERLQDSDPIQSYYEESAASDQESRCTRAKLIAQVYHLDPLECSRRQSPMKVIAIITEPEKVKNTTTFGINWLPHPMAEADLHVPVKPSVCVSPVD